MRRNLVIMAGVGLAFTTLFPALAQDQAPPDAPVPTVAAPVTATPAALDV